MSWILGGVIGLVIGYLLALVIRRGSMSEAAAQQARLEAELAAAKREAQEKLALLADARARLEESFRAVAGETLKANSESFAALARSQLEAVLAQEETNLEKRREAIEKVMAPLGESLRRYEEQIKSLEKERGQSYHELRQQTVSLAEGQEKLRKETGNLVNALRQPQVRGRWGELTLRRVAELAGMINYCDFFEQVSVNTPEGRQRPDMIVRLPAGREIVVDSKVSLSAYLDALAADTEEEREKRLVQHAAQVRAHMGRLASKEYTKQFAKAPEFIVLFIPGESFLTAAVQRDLLLIEEGLESNVVIATPSTLVALLKAVEHGWRQASLEENARKISLAGAELYERLAVVCRHYADLGSALHRAMHLYNQANASINTRLLPSARRMKELGATSAPEIEAAEPLDCLPAAPEGEGETSENK